MSVCFVKDLLFHWQANTLQLWCKRIQSHRCWNSDNWPIAHLWFEIWWIANTIQLGEGRYWSPDLFWKEGILSIRSRRDRKTKLESENERIDEWNIRNERRLEWTIRPSGRAFEDNNHDHHEHTHYNQHGLQTEIWDMNNRGNRIIDPALSDDHYMRGIGLYLVPVDFCSNQ